jgi:hypothetical protein
MRLLIQTSESLIQILHILCPYPSHSRLCYILIISYSRVTLDIILLAVPLESSLGS